MNGFGRGARRRRTARLLAVALVATGITAFSVPNIGAATTPPSDAPAGSATTYQLTPTHDGSSSDDLALPLGQLWSHDFGANVSYPLVVSGRVFVATTDHDGAYGSKLWALDAATGAVVWGPVDVGGTYFITGIAADGDNIYAVNFNGLLRSLSQADGSVLWSRQLPGQYAFTSPPTVKSGTVYVGGAGSGGTLYAVDAGSGAVRWTASVSNGDHSSPAVTSDGVYVSYACEVAYRFNPSNGTNVWTHRTNCSGGGGRTPVVHDNGVYVRDDAGKPPVVLSTESGAETASFNSVRTPAFSDDHAFLMQGSGTLGAATTLTAVDVATGATLWSQPGDGHLVTAPLAIGDKVAVGSSTGEVYLYDAETGTELWSADTGSDILPTDEHNATMLVGLAESANELFVPATNTLVAYALGGEPPSTTTTIPVETTTTVKLPPPTSPPVSGTSVGVSPSALVFGRQRVATFGRSASVTIRNRGPASVKLKNVRIAGPDPADFFGTTNCFRKGRPAVLGAGATCRVELFFAPLRFGARRAALEVAIGTSTRRIPLSGNGTEGYIVAGARGEVAGYGDAVAHGNATNLQLKAPIISLATTANGAGYWLLGGDGGIFSFGNAHFFGSTGAMHLNRPIVTMAATPNGKGYWLVGSDGGIFSFGNAHFFGSTGAMHLNQPIVGMAASANGKGYWLVARDGGIFAFGDAHFYGSAVGMRLSAPVIGMSPTPSGHGYWLLTSDGHLYPFGDAHFFGSATGQQIVAMAPTPDGRGYWEISRTGGVFAYGDAKFFGRPSGAGVDDVIGIAGTAPPIPPELLPYAARATRPHSAELHASARGRVRMSVGSRGPN